MMTPALNQLPLAPLGAGDLIDRAVRLYRRHLFTLIRSSPIDSDLSVGDEKSLLGIFSVNLKKAIATGDPEYISKQSAGDLARLHDTMFERAFLRLGRFKL